jgi:hypothetical protein
MSPQSRVVTVPPMELSLDQFLGVIRQLDKPTRIEVARVLAETEMDTQLRGMIEQLANTPLDRIQTYRRRLPCDGITDLSGVVRR